MRRCIPLLAALTLAVMGVAAPTSAQVPLDSVTVTIYDPADLTVDIRPVEYRGFRGDTVTFSATVVDGPTGDTLDVELAWSTDSPTAVMIDPISGFATFLSRGQHRIYAEVVSIRSEDLVITSSLDGVTWVDHSDGTLLELQVGQAALVCAYHVEVTQTIGGHTTTPLGRSSVDCPGDGLPAIDVTWSSSETSVATVG